MKQKRNRILLGLCMAVCLLLLAACGSKASATGSAVDQEVMDSLGQASEGLISQITSFTAEEAEEMEATLILQEQTVLANALASWRNVMNDTGSFLQVTSNVSEVTDDGQVCVTMMADFDKRQAEVKFFFEQSAQGWIPSAISISPVYSTGENMAKAAMNTLMGMGTVFVVLIFISLLISSFKFIRVFEDKMKAKNAPAKAPAAPVPAPVIPVPVVEEAEEDLSDDLELVAVITAAIAASTNASADGLIVRSIKRAPGAKWKRA